MNVDNIKSKFDKFFIREKVIRAIREFFYSQYFHEVETPILTPAVIPESYVEYFETYLLDRKRNRKKIFLSTSPEASLKKLLVLGIGNCFEITKSFRNTESGSMTHNPEFTILEWYRVGAQYMDIIKDCEALITHICRYLNISAINYQGRLIDVSNPWPRLSVSQALERFCGLSLDSITDRYANTVHTMFSVSRILPSARKKGYKVKATDTWETIFNQIYLNEIEPMLKEYNTPVVIYDFPRPMAALAKLNKDDPREAQRFEFYIGGLELGDCYSELTDWSEQKNRFKSEQDERKRLKKTAVMADSDFIAALKHGLPECAGIAVGVDRLCMLFTDTKRIQDLLLFPLE